MTGDYVFLIEKEEIWAKVLMEVLADHGIPYAVRALYGAGFVLRTGAAEWLKIYVPADCFEKAAGLADELFSGEGVEEDADEP